MPSLSRASAPYISIHALREEGDKKAKIMAASILEISIHALREEGVNEHTVQETKTQ